MSGRCDLSGGSATMLVFGLSWRLLIIEVFLFAVTQAVPCLRPAVRLLGRREARLLEGPQQYGCCFCVTLRLSGGREASLAGGPRAVSCLWQAALFRRKRSSLIVKA